MSRTPVYIICSPRPFVGKTLIARALCELLLLQRGAVLAFDVNVKEPSLIDYLPHVTETAEIDDTLGKMALMDRLIEADNLAKVVDLGYHSFDEFFNMTAEIGFLKEAARRQVVPVVLYIADTDRKSAYAYDLLHGMIPPRQLIVIDNEHVVFGELPKVFTLGRVLRVPALSPFLKTYIDRVSFSCTGYLRSEPDSTTELSQWIRVTYNRLRELELELSRPRT
jgi:hypothetical protein